MNEPQVDDKPTQELFCQDCGKSTAQLWVFRPTFSSKLPIVEICQSCANKGSQKILRNTQYSVHTRTLGAFL